MKALKRQFDRMRPHFMPGGKLHSLRSVYDGFETFLFTPNETSGTCGAHIHDANDSKRTMILVVLALMPCFLFGMYNTGYQHWLSTGATEFPFWQIFAYGFLATLPRVVVTYVVGLGIEFIVAQWRGEEIQEGFLVTGILVPMICPIGTPLWMLAVATAFSVIFVKEVFGGTGYNILNVALVTRAFLFFAYPKQMSGDSVFVATQPICGLGGTAVDGFTGATPLGEIAISTSQEQVEQIASNSWDAFLGLIPGSMGETSTLCILIGAAILLLTGMASWKIMLSAFAGAFAMGALVHAFPSDTYPASYLTPIDQMLYGGFAFAAVFMATDPVTSARTETGKWIYGALVGVIAILIRVYNGGYPEGAMLAVILMNVFAPLIDHCVVQANVSRRLRRAQTPESKQ
jgi:Na+-transporting NADH:ubiquinone oxidoreductase subunit B